MAGEAALPQPTIEATPKRRSSSGVTAALSEAAQVDEEIREIQQSTTNGGPSPDETSPDQVFRPEDDDYDPEFDEEDTKQGVRVKEAIDRIQSRRQIVTQNFVLYSEKEQFGDEDSETSAPVITSAGRLEDEGASDLFGVLEVLDRGTLDELGFSPEEEVSLETESGDYGAGETKLGMLSVDDEEETEGEVFDDEPTASVTDADVLSVSQLLKNSSVPLEPGIVEVDDEASGISISLEPGDRLRDEIELIDDRSGFEFEFTDNEEPTEEQDSQPGRPANGRPRSVLDTPAGMQFIDDTSNQRPVRLISDSFDLEQNPDPNPRANGARSEGLRAEPGARPSPERAPRPPVRPVSMEADTRPSNPDEMAPARAKPSNASQLRRVVQRQKVAKEVRSKGTAPGALAASPSVAPIIPPLPASGSAAPMPAKPSRAAPSAGQFYPPVQNVEARSATALNRFATFAVLIAVLLAVAAAVSILLQNRARVPIPPMADTEAPVQLPKMPKAPVSPPPPAPPLADRTPPPVAPPAPATPPKAPPPKRRADLPSKTQAKTPPPKAPPPKAPPPKAPPPKAPPPKAPPPKGPPAKRRTRVAKKASRTEVTPRTQDGEGGKASRTEVTPRTQDGESGKAKTPEPRSPKADQVVLRISCSDPIDIKISGVGIVKQKKKYRRRMSPGLYRVTLIKGSQKRPYELDLVPGDPVILRCPF